MSIALPSQHSWIYLEIILEYYVIYVLYSIYTIISETIFNQSQIITTKNH